MQVRRAAAAATASRTLFIVESPTKASKMSGFLGSEVDVFASYGHFRRLPSKPGAVEPEAGFKMHWEIDPRRKELLRKIEAAAKGAGTIVLATDPDREGEAISWHMAEYLKACAASLISCSRVSSMSAYMHIPSCYFI
jgi:DNA topoisomerase I